MAFRKTKMNEIFGTVLVLSALLSTASAVDCFGKSFHCVNATHFMICVDLGGGVSQSIDDFLIPCPPPTVCQGNNHFECEFPAVTTPPTTLSNVISETTEPWAEIVVTTNSPPKNSSTTKEYSEKYMNTVSLTTVAEDNLTTDTTVDIVTTEASALNNVNNNSNISEIVPISPIYEATIGFDGITQTMPDKILISAAEITTDMPQIPLDQIRNVTNETTINNVTLISSVTEPTGIMNNNYTNESNDLVGDVRNITVTSQADNVTNINIFDDVVTSDTLLIDPSNGTEPPSKTITDESLLTDDNQVVTTDTQSLVSTDGLQNSGNLNIQTATIEPAIIQNTIEPVFEENLTTYSVQDFATEQSTVLTPEVVQSTQTELPITTYQSTVTTITSINVKDELTVETTIGLDQITTTIYEEDFSTAVHDIYTTEAPLSIATNGKQDTQNINVSDKASTKFIDDTIVYMGIDQSTPDIKRLSSNIDVTTEQTIAFTTETQKLLVTEQSKTNKDSSATEKIQQPIVKDSLKPSHMGIEQSTPDINGLSSNIDVTTEKTIAFTTETQKLLVTEQSKTNKDSSATEKIQQPIVKDSLKPSHMGIEQSTPDINGLSSNIDVTTEQTIAFTTETQKLQVAEQSKTNKDSSATEKIQQPIVKDSLKPSHMGIEQSTPDINGLSSNIDVTTEQTIAFTTETQKLLVTEQSKTNKDSSATEKIQQPIVKDSLKPSHMGIEQSTPDINRLSSNIDVTTEQTIAFTTQTKLLVTEQSKINKNSSATEKIQQPIAKDSLKPSQKRLNTDQAAITENPSDLATEAQRQLGTENITVNKYITTIGNDEATEASALPMEAQKPIYKSVEQSDDSTISLATNSDIITENPVELITEKSKQEETGQLLTTNKNISSSGNEVIAETSILSTEEPKPIHNEDEQQKTGTKILPTDNISIFTTVTQKTNYIGTEQPTTIKSHLLIDSDVTTDKVSVYATDTQESTKQIIEVEKPFFLGTDKTTTNTNKLAINNDGTVEKVSDFIKEVQKPIYKSIEHPITSKQNLATDKDTIAENTRVFGMETEKPIDMSNQQSTTNKSSLETDMDVNAGKASIFTTEPTLMSTVQLTTINNDLATDIEVSPETAIGSATGTSKSAIKIQKEIEFGISDYNIATEQQKQESLSTDTTVKTTTEKNIILFGAITTDNIMQSAGVTEQPITTAFGDNIVIDTTTSNIESTATKIVQSINTTTITEATTLTIPEDKIKEEITGFTSNAKANVSDKVNELPVDNVQTVNNIINEQPNQNSFEFTTGTVDSLISTTVKSVYITKDDRLSSTESTLNLRNGQQKITLSSQIDKSDLANEVTTDASPDIANDINTPIINGDTSINNDTKVDTTSALEINEVNYSNQKTVKSTTQDIPSVVENVDNNQHTTESNLKAIGTAVTTRETTSYDNMEGSDTDISNAAVNEHIIETDTVNSEIYATERANLIPAENVGAHVVKELPLTETVELQSISTLNLNQVNDSLDSRLQVDSYNKSKNSNSAYSGQLSGAEVTSKTTATDNVTPSLNPNNESSQKDKHFTSNNQVNTENTEIVIDNLADQTSSFTTASNTILNEKDNDLNIVLTENGNIYNTLPSLNTQENTYVSFTTEKSSSSFYNEANNQVPELTAISENVTKETLQLSTQTNDLKHSLVTSANNDVNDFTTITGVIENTETTFTEKSTTIDGIDFELPITNKNEIVQEAETTTQPFDNVEPMKTLSPIKNENVNNLLSTQDNSYVSFTTEKEAISPFNELKNHAPKSTAISENVTQATLQLSTQTNDLKPSHVTSANNDVDNFTTNKNEIIQRVETTTRPFDNGEPMQTIAPIENDNVNKILSTQDNSYVSFTTEKEASSLYNEVKNHVPKLTAISENATQETLLLSHAVTQTNDLKPSPETSGNNDVDDFTTITGIIENTGTSFTEKSTTIDGIHYELHITNKKEIVERVETTTQPFVDGEPMQTISPIKNENVNNLLFTQDNSYVSFTTEKEASSPYNVAENYVPKLTAISENVTQETLQLSTQSNDFKFSPVTYANNDVDNFTTITGVIENTGSSFTEKSTTIDGIDFELHITNKNEIVQRDETTTQPFDNGEPMQTISPIKNENVTNLLFNPLSNILLDKQNQAVKPATEGTMYFSTKNDETVNSMDILSTGTFPITDVSSAQLSQVENTNDVTNQVSIPLVKMNDNLPSSRLNSLPVTHDLQKTWQAESMAKTEKPSFIQTKTISLKESSAPKEELVSNSGDVVTSYAIPTTDSTAEFSIIEGVQNVYKTIESYFSTPSETSTPGTFNKKGNGDITPIRSSYDIQDKTKTSSSAYSTESSLIENNEHFDSLITKLGPIDLLPPVTYSGDYSKMEMSTESSKNGGGGGGGGDNTIFNKPAISEALPVPNYEINTDKPNKNTTQANKTSETKVFKEPLSATSNPRKYVTSTINNYQYVTVKSDSNTASESSGSTGTVDIPSEVSQQNVNALKTDAKSLPGQSNDQNNSSFYSDKASSGSKSTLVAQSTYSKSFNNLTNAVNKESYSKSQTDSAITTSQVPEKVSLETNTVNTETNGNTLQNNSSIEPRIIYLGKNSTITVTASKDVLKDIIKNGSALLQNSTNTTKFNTQGDLKSQQKTTMNPTEHDAGQVRPTTSKQDITHPVTTISQVSSTKITPTPVAPTTTTENVSKKIPKTAPVNYNCINGLRSRYSDKNDCRKFYICLGNSQPIIGNCPANTVFSDISKMCTKNLSHCIRENEFKCPSTGRFSDVLKDNVYYICVSHKNHLFRFKFLCQKGFTLNKATIRCIENREIESNESVSISLSENSSDRSISSKTSSSSSSASSSSNSGSSTSMSTSSDSSSSSDSSNSKDNNGSSVSTTSKSKEKEESTEKPEGKEGDEEDEVFECEKEGKFPVRNDCRRYYLCKKNRKSEYRRKIKKCESGDVFHKGKKNSNNSRESSNSENNSDRHPSKRRQRKEKKEEPESSHSEDNSDRYPSKRRQRKEKKEEPESSHSEDNSDRYPSKRRQRKEKKEESESSHSEDNSDRYPSKRRQRKEKKEESESSDSENNSDRHHSKRRQRKEKKEEPENEEDDEKEVFECEREGKFPVPGDCRRYYLCKKNRKSEYRRKIRKCDSDEVFHKSKKKCVDADSYEC